MADQIGLGVLSSEGHKSDTLAGFYSQNSLLPILAWAAGETNVASPLSAFGY